MPIASTSLALSRQRLTPCIRTARLALPTSRHASSKSKNPIVLEKPDRFRPPSHPQRIIKKKPVEYGPITTEAQRQEWKQKQYPHMFPPEGTFMFKFLTNKYIHAWIATSVLASLALYVFIQDFLSKTVYRDLLPSRSDFLSHPFEFIRRWITVYKMSVEYDSQKVAAMRQKNYEDIQKQKEYRRAHGVTAEPSLLGRLTGVELGTEGSKTGDSPDNGEADVVVPGLAGTQDRQRLPDDNSPQAEYTDFEGKRKKPKRWLGIWE